MTKEAEPCWLCARPLGRRVERHHPIPKSRKGRETVPVHPICHRVITAYRRRSAISAVIFFFLNMSDFTSSRTSLQPLALPG